MTAEHPPAPSLMRDHWWWRPGWAVGRSFYTWHITFADQLAMQQLAAYYAPVLANLPMLEPVPVEWLHLTMQGLGFTNEVDQADVAAIVEAAQRRCADLAPFTITLGPPHLDPEGVQLAVQPVEPLRQLRATIRAGMADVWGTDGVPEPEAWRPHVSLAYSNAVGPTEPIATVLVGAPPRTAEVEVRQVSLIDLNRDNKRYEWGEVAMVRLGGQQGSY